MKDMEATHDTLIRDWQDAVGKTIESVDWEKDDTYLEDIYYNIIRFTDGSVAIQRDQSCHTTFCGLVEDLSEANEVLKNID
jgi:hypothetical protein